MKLAAATPPWRPDLKAAAVLAVAAALATAGLFPYLLQLMPEQFAKIPLPLPLLVLAQSLQALVLLGILALLGLRMGHRLGLGAPALQRWCGADTPAQQRPAPLLAVVSGALGGGAVLLSSLVIEPWLPPMLNPPTAGLSAFNGLLASFYGGIAEELQMRLFLMTLLLWMVARVLRRRPGAAGYWLAVIVAALLFGAGHLPAAQHIWGLDGVVVMRTLVLNGVLGVLCGWLYWRRGLETAMLAHFSADLILHVLPPLLKLGAH